MATILLILIFVAGSVGHKVKLHYDFSILSNDMDMVKVVQLYITVCMHLYVEGFFQ